MAAFRAEVRAWLEENCPPSLRTPATSAEEVWGGRRATFPSDDARRWLERCAARGYTAPTWPRGYGGAGLSAAQARVLEQEQRALGCRRPLVSFGVWMLGPVLLEFGSDAQKAEHLPPIARGEIRWCQGYSEPGAGSDLASLQTRAVRDGDDFVVDGAKVWTSFADKSDMMFCLVRTNPDAPKHAGISFLLIDMAAPGVSVRPITLISGSSPFCETRFDGVRVPARNLVGTLDGGWTIAKRLLEHERSVISLMRDAAPEDTETLAAMARRCLGVTADGRIADPILRDEVIAADVDFLCNRLTLQRSREAAQAGRGPGAESSMFKLYGTELSKRRKDLRVRLAGYQGLGWDGDGYTAAELQVTRDWLRSRASSIEGGTSEIQLNIIAKRVLGLPD
ncbi:MAG: acyl-CoA dehydrogenase family protein [Kofleriaceae bacterium]|nr:acyl-CoA dehydrogenase family protein [Kofleriaceae bacterium]MCB9573811.1 acyl-CoA dehydrogenase family protein [Kofleriaceae bacterium]